MTEIEILSDLMVKLSASVNATLKSFSEFNKAAAAKLLELQARIERLEKEGGTE